MKFRRKLVGVALAGVVVLAPSSAGAPETTTLTATIVAGDIGSRTLVIAAPIVMASDIGIGTLEGSLAATVTEVTRTGTNPWYVTAAVGDLTNTDLSTDNDTISNAALEISDRSVEQVLGGGTAAADPDPATMSAAATLFETLDQDEAAVYSGTYASTSTWTLTPPNGAKTGEYTGTVTVTLFQ